MHSIANSISDFDFCFFFSRFLISVVVLLQFITIVCSNVRMSLLIVSIFLKIKYLQTNTVSVRKGCFPAVVDDAGNDILIWWYYYYIRHTLL